MRVPQKQLVSLAVLAMTFVAVKGALAQEKVQAAEVLLLLDTSGSMSYAGMRDPVTGLPRRPVCSTNPLSPMNVNINATAFDTASTPTYTPPDRWNALVSALTGSVKGHACWAQDRASQDFLNEYKLLAGSTPQSPYDYRYYLPFNRIVAASGSELCTPAPSWNSVIRSNLATSPFSWATDDTASPVLWRKITAGNFDTTSVTPCSFEPQAVDGAIDQYEGVIRFGLMTFDPISAYNDAGTLKSGTGLSSAVSDYPSGIGGAWSYFNGWLTNSDANAAWGNPGGCSSGPALFEVGCRNPVAPPWEGRLMSFGDPFAKYEEIVRNNQRVQQVVLGMRPFGGTPVAGMLEDAKYFLLADKDMSHKTNNYYGAGKDSSGFYDPWVTDDPAAKGCRRRFAVLITDGGPNLDMQPYCKAGTPAGKCPYIDPSDASDPDGTPAGKARYLRNHNVPVYVIGYSVTADGGTGVNQTCTSLFTDPNACATSKILPCDSGCPSKNQCAYGYCIQSPMDELRATCCTISNIAKEGWALDDPGTAHAYFAESPAALKVALTEILAKTVGKEASETAPVFATGTSLVTSGSTVASNRFFASFQPSPGDLTLGRLKRTRYVCQSNLVPLADPYDADKDDYAGRLDLHKGERTIMTAVGATNSSQSVRPLFGLTAPNDGLGYQDIDSVQSGNMISAQASSFATTVPGKGMYSDSTCETSGAYCCFPTSASRPLRSECSSRFLTMELGTGKPASIDYVRTSAFGAIMHSTPVAMKAPSSLIPNPAYADFQRIMKSRVPVLFSATIDGQLHAFDVSNDAPTELNEIWSFIPPSILPLVPAQFPNQYKASAQILLDGPTVIQDVAGTALNTGRFFLSRTRAMANDPTQTRWYTVLIGSMGASGGYFAMDVTWPDATKAVPTGSGYHKGPRFLWQLTSDGDGNPIFGDRAIGTPAITTLYFKAPGETYPAEHAVAILPGGAGGVSTAEYDTDPDCSSGNDDYDESQLSFSAKVKYRCNYRRYTSKDDNNVSKRALGGARSVTVVMLATGEVVRTFRRSADKLDLQGPPGLYDQSRVTVVPFRAPLIGQVGVYPVGAGAVSDRAYVGDAEGFLWRMDFTDTDSSHWSGKLFFDAFPQSNTYLGSSLGTYSWANGQPIETPLVMSVDPLGRPTLNFSTGDQREMSSKGDNFVWSISEHRKSGVPTAKINWFLGPANHGVTTVPGAFANGHRVTGPMVLFNGQLYFTTYQQASSSNSEMCGVGKSFLWGVDYLKAGLVGGNFDSKKPYEGPMPGWSNAYSTVPDYNTGAPISGGALSAYTRLGMELGSFLAYGAGLTQVPTCYKEETQTDPYFGSYSSTTTKNTGNYQLIVQTGKTLTGGLPETMKINLPPPVTAVKVSSWASILE